MKNRKGVNCSIGGGGASKIKPVSRETATVTLWTLMSPQANVSQPPNESWHMHDRSSHHQAQLSPLQVVTHLVSLMPWQCTPEECCVITCTPSMNNVWTQKTQNINAHGKKWKKWVTLYTHGLWYNLHFFYDFQSQADFFCFTLLPIHHHPLSTTSCHYFFWIHARVHKSPICHDIWWTRQGLQESGPVWGCDLVSSLSASGSTGTEVRKGWRRWGERRYGISERVGVGGQRRLGVEFMLQFGPGDKLAVLRLEG